MEADYSRLPFPSDKKRNITVKESKKKKNPKPKTKKASQIMIPEKGQRTAIVRVVIHNSDQLITHLCMRGKAKRVREKEFKKKKKKINQKTRASREREEGLLCPHILPRGDETKGMTEENE